MARHTTTWVNKLGSYTRVASEAGLNVLIYGVNKYLNFGTFSGSTGYGIRDNNGTMEYKNYLGVWTAFGSGGGGGGTGDFMADGSVPMTGNFNADGNDIDNAGRIGLGGVVAISKLHIGNVAPNEYFANVTDGNPGSVLFRIRRTFDSIDFSAFFGYVFKFEAPVHVPIEAYDVSAWNGSAKTVTQSAFRDKIDIMDTAIAGKISEEEAYYYAVAF